MEIQFNNPYLEKIYWNDHLSGKQAYSWEVIEQFRKKVLFLKQINNTNQLKQHHGLNFEALKGNKRGRYSIRVNKQYRLEFRIEKDIIKVVEIVVIEDLSKHYE